jgi:hypothetical protein
MSITHDDIADALDDVQENEVAAWLADTNQFNELANSIATVAENDNPASVLMGNVQQLINMCREYRYQLATKKAQHKDDARRFQASMADSYDGDDYQWRVA